MERIRLGAIGLGKVFQLEHLPSIRRNLDAELVALCDTNRELLQRVADVSRVKKTYTSPEEMLRKEKLDAALVLVPHDLHEPLTRLVAEHGVNVFCEKPMALTLKQADNMINACRKADVKLAVACNERFAPMIQRAKLILETEFQKPVNVLATMVYSIDMILREGYAVLDARNPDLEPTGHWRDDPTRYGSTTHDFLVHIYDLVRWLIRADAKKLYAERGRLAYSRIRMEDNAVSVVRYDNNAIGTFLFSQSGSEALGFERIEIIGIGERLLVDDMSTVRFAVVGKETREWKKPGVETSWYGEQGRTSLWGGYEAQMNHFIECIKNDKTPMNTGEEGRKALEMVIATHKSAEENRPIDFPIKE